MSSLLKHLNAILEPFEFIDELGVPRVEVSDLSVVFPESFTEIDNGHNEPEDCEVMKEIDHSCS